MVSRQEVPNNRKYPYGDRQPIGWGVNPGMSPIIWSQVCDVPYKDDRGSGDCLDFYDSRDLFDSSLKYTDIANLEN